MVQIVEIRYIGTDVEGTMAEFQAWLGRHEIRPIVLEHSTGGPGITFRVHFSLENEARAFADKFKGRLNCGAQPDEAALWHLIPKRRVSI